VGHPPSTVDDRLRLLAQPAVVAAAGLGSVALLSWLDHTGLSVLPACPFLSITGLWCPLCGGTRAVEALAAGDIGAALGFNLLVVLAVPLVVAEWLRWTTGRARGRPTSFMNVSSRTLAVVAGLAVLYMVVRNVPGVEMLTPSG
jgi:hypothetical protein